MFTGTPEEQQRQEAEARAVAARIAEALADLEAFGHVTLTPGAVRFPGGMIRRVGDTWTVD